MILPFDKHLVRGLRVVRTECKPRSPIRQRILPERGGRHERLNGQVDVGVVPRRIRDRPRGLANGGPQRRLFNVSGRLSDQMLVHAHYKSIVKNL